MQEQSRTEKQPPLANKKRRRGSRSGGAKLALKRRWTTVGEDVFDNTQWSKRDAKISGLNGATIFEQKDVEVPAGWSQLATDVVVSKYFRGALNSSERETSVRELIGRVVDTLADWATKGDYFRTPKDVKAFADELKYLLLHQYASFNSPVWFNVGIEPNPQCSACFINSVEDTMESILKLVETEGMLFRHGSGSGVNLSQLRGSCEQIRGGGRASGPLSFMRGYDAFAGAIKSGGKTRRAAKMVMLDIDHPDIVEFVRCKTREEEKAKALIDAGFDGSFDGEAYNSVSFQNGNNSVRVSDEFMESVEKKKPWKTIERVSGNVAETLDAKELLAEIAKNAWRTGDPGIQFNTTINRWHTCKSSGPITGSNPCSEYMFLSDSACNLASLNLLKFRAEDGEFEVDAFTDAVDILFTAQEIIVDNAGYPNEALTKNSHDFRPLGLGYANLGALLMSQGWAYDSDIGRGYAAAITALMGGAAYAQSARIARTKGYFKAYPENKESMREVMGLHSNALKEIDEDLVPSSLLEGAHKAWESAIELGEKWGYRNAQATVLAPTGTIGFMMDCDTTGIEPELSLVKYKKLVGGGTLKIVNQGVDSALNNLGYDKATVKDIVSFLEENDTIEGAPGLRKDQLSVFDCAFKPAKGKRSINPMGHIRMMAAVQPFLSGAISKTVNLPNTASVEDICEVYTKAWRLGLKAVAIYRDGCKSVQPLTTKLEEKKKEEAVQEKPSLSRGRLPNERQALTHKFSIAGHEGYITVGLYDDGNPGEVFITMSKEGSTISGLMDSFATLVSLALQYGVSLKVLTDKFMHTRYEPSGFTGNPDIPMAKSITDYIFRWLALKFPEGSRADATTCDSAQVQSNASNIRIETQEKAVFTSQADSPSCADCGSIMVRNGACYKCLNCGSTSGCS